MPQVLIVEDELEILELIQDALKARGVQVKAAPTDREALALLEREASETAVLVTDINLGAGVTGFDIARRADPEPRTHGGLHHGQSPPRSALRCRRGIGCREALRPGRVR